MPAATPLTMPEEVPIVAISVLLLDHTPLGDKLVNDIDEPIQTVLSAPAIDDAGGLTVTVSVISQARPDVNVIIDVPGVTPVTMPDAEPTVACPTLPLVHVPPVEALANVAVVNPVPPHIAAAPVIAEGLGFTVHTAVTWQPLGAT